MFFFYAEFCFFFVTEGGEGDVVGVLLGEHGGVGVGVGGDDGRPVVCEMTNLEKLVVCTKIFFSLSSI